MSNNKFSQFDEYPIRPEMIVGESLFSYIYRFLTLNGHKISSELNEIINRSFSKKPEIAKQNQLLISNMMGDKLLCDPSEWYEHYLQKDGRYHIGYHNTRVLRFCPHCLDNTGAHFLFWTFPLVVVCPEHKEFLSDHCESCNQPYEWRKLKSDWRCKCGASMQAKSPPKTLAPLNLVILAQLVAAAKEIRLSPKLKLAWSGRQSSNAYGLKSLYSLLEGPYRYILDGANPYLPEEFVRQFVLH
jgi:hypothetical protein